MAVNGEITVGTYIAFASLVVWIIWPMRGLGRLIVQTSTGLVSYKRVAHILEQTRESLTEGSYEPETDVKGEVVFDHVNFEYEADNLVLKDISFTCQPGSVIALLGSTGSGKTSLVNLLPRFYDPTSGVITLDGVNLTEYPRKFLRSQIGIVEQEPSCSPARSRRTSPMAFIARSRMKRLFRRLNLLPSMMSLKNFRMVMRLWLVNVV